MIKARGKTGDIRKLIFTESFLLVDAKDTIECHVNYEDSEGDKITCRFDFVVSDHGDPYTSWLQENDGGRHQIWTLNRWTHAAYVEVSDAVPVKVRDGNEKERLVWLKFRNYDPEHKNQRMFVVSIWLKV